MRATEVYEVFKAIGAENLHHANTVSTSCTFLQLGGLASRGYVEDAGLIQTPQSSDGIDKRYGIWHSIFLDHVDIHHRGGRRKGPNQYGPVLFIFDLELLLDLPAGTEIVVAKKNPIKFKDGEADEERWFQSKDELATQIQFGNFEKMAVIHSPTGLIRFPHQKARILLDASNRSLSTGDHADNHAHTRLLSAAQAGGIQISVEPSNCKDGCICKQKYASYQTAYIDHLFR